MIKTLAVRKLRMILVLSGVAAAFLVCAGAAHHAAQASIPGPGAVVYMQTGLGSISGVVKDGDGNPLAGVAISAKLLQESGSTITTETAAITATTDANGTYSISAAIGSYDVTFSKANFSTDTAGSVLVTADTATTVNMTMESTQI